LLHLKIPQAVFPIITASLYRYISKFHRRFFQLLLHTFTVTSQNSAGGVSSYYCINLTLHLKIPQAVFPIITAYLLLHPFTVTSQNSTGGVYNYYCVPLPLNLKIPQVVFPVITAYLYRYIWKFHGRCFQLLLHSFTVISQNSTGGVSNYYCIPLPLHLKIAQAVFPIITAYLCR